MSRPAVAVAGFGRCGSTMMMKCLDAGGYPPAGDISPISMELYDETDMGRIMRRPPEGRTVKTLDLVLRSPVPASRRWLFIVMTRTDTTAQAESTIRHLAAVAGIQIDPAKAPELARSFTADRPRLLDRCNQLGGQVAEFVMEDVIEHPAREMERLALLLPGFDPDAAATVPDRHHVATT